MTNTSKTAASFGLLILRVVVGAVFAAHGAQKVFEYTLPGTAKTFAGMGVPFAEFIGPAVALLELIGGGLLILGILTRPVALLLAINMVGAAFLVHIPNGFWISESGYEFVAVLGASALALVLTGAGRISLDRAVMRGPLRAMA